MSIFGMIGSAIGSAMNFGMNQGGNALNVKRSYKYGEMSADKAAQRQREYFDYTANYNTAKNQVERLKDAGLNPALMYGLGGGQGGATGAAPQGAGAGNQSNAQQAMMFGELKMKAKELEIAQTNAESEKAQSEAALKNAETNEALSGTKQQEVDQGAQALYLDSEKIAVQNKLADIQQQIANANDKNAESRAKEVETIRLNYELLAKKTPAEINKLIAEAGYINESIKLPQSQREYMAVLGAVASREGLNYQRHIDHEEELNYATKLKILSEVELNETKDNLAYIDAVAKMLIGGSMAIKPKPTKPTRKRGY